MNTVGSMMTSEHQRRLLRENWPPCGEFPHVIGDGRACEREESFSERYITSGFLSYAFIVLIFFALIGFLWLIVVRTFGIHTALSSTEFSVVFFVLSLFASASYNRLVQSSLDSYVKTQGDFLRLGQAVIDLASRYFCSTKVVNVERSKRLLAAMCYEAYRIFDSNASEQLTIDQLEVKEDIDLLRSTRAFSYPAESFRALHVLFIRDSHDLALDRYNQRVEDSVANASIGITVASPSIYTHLSYMIIFIYLVGFAPPYMLLSINYTLFLAMYPMILFIGFSPIIFNKWVGKAFEHKRRVPTIDYIAVVEHWIEIIRKRAETHAQEQQRTTTLPMK